MIRRESFEMNSSKKIFTAFKTSITTLVAVTLIGKSFLEVVSTNVNQKYSSAEE